MQLKFTECVYGCLSNNLTKSVINTRAKAKILSTKSAGFSLCILHSSVFSIHYSLNSDRIFEMNTEDLRLKNE